MGFTVDKTTNGQAVDAFEQSPVGRYDIVLMDVMMPVMDGLTAAHRIRQPWPRRCRRRAHRGNQRERVRRRRETIVGQRHERPRLQAHRPGKAGEGAGQGDAIKAAAPCGSHATAAAGSRPCLRCALPFAATLESRATTADDTLKPRLRHSIRQPRRARAHRHSHVRLITHGEPLFSGSPFTFAIAFALAV